MITPIPIPMPVNTSSGSDTELIFSIPMDVIGIAIAAILVASTFACFVCMLLDACYDKDTELALKISFTTLIATFGVGIIYVVLLLCGVGVEVTI